VEFGIMMWPLSVVNNSLKLCISSLALSFRKRLTRYAHDQYLNGITFYKVSNIDNRIQNADQLLTQDIDKFADSLSHLYSDIAKPLVDIFLFAHKLGQAMYVLNSTSLPRVNLIEISF
jgi:ATP-binding cassette subfamily D (ALD) protein 3